jgi:hypothetical protein
MITLDKKHKKAVDAARKEIVKHTKAQDATFLRLCKKLKVDGNSPEGDSLWDHIFNDTDWVIEYND